MVMQQCSPSVFLAATILPLGSEWLLILLLTRELDPIMLVSLATLGNYLGACTTYAIGFYGSDIMIERLLKIDKQKRAKAERLYNKYGALSLAMSWLPIIGDPLCLVGGLFRYSFFPFQHSGQCRETGKIHFLSVFDP